MRSADLKTLPTARLEQRLKEVDSELEQLARFTMRGGTGSLGYRSTIHPQPDSTERVRIALDEEVAIDEVVLVPVLYRDADSGLRSGGFPIAFRILAGTEHSTHVVASFTAEDHLLPRIAPLVVPFQPVMASWVEIEATTLSPESNLPNRNTLELSEIMIFSGIENVALPKSNTVTRVRRPQKLRYLTDGFTPFLMNAAQGPSSQSRLISITSQTPPLLTIDLQASQLVHQINLHTPNTTASVPMRQLSCWGVPRHIRIMGANRPDFADETFLCEYKQQSIYDNGPIMMRRFPEARCRYIRLEILDPQSVIRLNAERLFIAFAEIEVLSKGQNTAQGAPITASSSITYSKSGQVRMTDGLNYYGPILPIRDWMEQLARRHDLERTRPLVVEELAQRYRQQKATVRILSWVATFLVATVIILILIDRNIRQRVAFKTREQVAADLHDELGANLHAMGLLSDLALTARSEPHKLDEFLKEMGSLTRQTGEAARHCTNLLEAEEFYDDPVSNMERAARRLLADMDHQLTVEGSEYLARLSPRKRLDLFLFHKECLTNILRHSDATEVRSRLVADIRSMVLTVSDNGQGISPGTDAAVPASLQRRARLMRARVKVSSSGESGTTIELRMKNSKPRKGIATKERNVTSV